MAVAWLCGADGCPGGWFRASRDPDTGDLDFRVVEAVPDLLHTPPIPRIVALDIPIGLPEAGSRACDVAARRLLGPRRSSVFPAPIRPALAAASRLEASEITRRIDGRRVSAQAWGIVRKIREVDALLAASRLARQIIREVHPEVSFRAWNDGVAMTAAKRRPAGRAERLALAERWLGAGVLDRARGAHLRKQVADDDILDAIAGLWTAHRIADGTAVSLPEDPPRDIVDLRMEIVY